MLRALPFAACNSDGRALLFLPLLAGCGIYHYAYNGTPSLTGKPGKTTGAVVGVDDRNRENPGRFKSEYVCDQCTQFLTGDFAKRFLSRGLPLSDKFGEIGRF
jgi:hypothetical protein